MFISKDEANQYVSAKEEPSAVPEFYNPKPETIEFFKGIQHKIGKCYDWKDQKGQEIELLRSRGFRYAYNLGYSPATMALYTNIELDTDMEDLTSKEWFDLELSE